MGRRVVKTLPENDGSDRLSALLKEWRADGDLPAGFQTAVWARIDRAASARRVSNPFGAAVLEWFNQLVARPQVAVASIALFVVVGMTAGWTQGRREVARVEQELAQKYVQTINPYEARR